MHCRSDQTKKIQCKIKYPDYSKFFCIVIKLALEGKILKLPTRLHHVFSNIFLFNNTIKKHTIGKTLHVLFPKKIQYGF